MSLDVYLETEEGTPERWAIFVREDGSHKEVTLEEWNQRFPGREPVLCHVGGSTDVYSRNITHNLNAMAREAGIYEALWRPAEMDPAIKARIQEQSAAGNYHGAGGAFDIEENASPAHARDLIEPLQNGLNLLLADPARFEKHNPDNGWGDYDGLVNFVEEYLAACIENPEARVRVSR